LMTPDDEESGATMSHLNYEGEAFMAAQQKPQTTNQAQPQPGKPGAKPAQPQQAPAKPAAAPAKPAAPAPGKGR